MDIYNLINEIQQYISSIEDLDEKVDAINRIRDGISQVALSGRSLRTAYSG